MDPEQAFANWFENLPPGQRQTLAYLHLLMTSATGNDFALTPEEALTRFQTLLRTPDFPLRRAARLLMIRSVFSFLLSDVDFMLRQLAGSPRIERDLLPISPFQWLRSAALWRRLCCGELSDASLHDWLTGQQGR